MERLHDTPASRVLAFSISVAIHAVVISIPLLLDTRMARKVIQLRFDVVRREVVKPPAPPKAVSPPPKTTTKRHTVQRRRAAPRGADKKPTRDPPPPPVFGANERSTTGEDSSFSIPVGNTVATSPRNTGPVSKEERVEGRVLKPPPPPPPPRVRVPPKVLQEHKVPYPSKAQILGIEGTVVARVLVGEDGRVKQVKIISGPGFGLNRAAQRALGRFVFRPAVGTHGRAMPHWIIYRYTFRIDD